MALAPHGASRVDDIAIFSGLPNDQLRELKRRLTIEASVCNKGRSLYNRPRVSFLPVPFAQKWLVNLKTRQET
jgi:hypothetical protein